MQPRRIVLLGSTGSIGTQAIDVVDGAPHLFEVVALSAGGGNLELLARQAVHTGAAAVGIASGDPQQLQDLIAEAARTAGRQGYRPEIISGPDASTRIAEVHADVVLNGITGSIGLAPTLAALKSGATLALANKESLIVGGALVKAAAREGQIVPVDSEHSAIAQCLRSGSAAEVEKLILTASGGPFRGRTREQLHGVSPQEALAHPTWDMGLMVTTNSATLVNKGLELIEAHLLFDVPLDRIDVVVHPQSVVHSMVQFVDGSVIAQASPPDMRLPIALGLGWPDRVPKAASPCDWTQATSWTFEPLDSQPSRPWTWPRTPPSRGAPSLPSSTRPTRKQSWPSTQGRIRFTDIVDTIDAVLSEHPGSSGLTLESVLDAESWARTRAHERLAVSSL